MLQCKDKKTKRCLKEKSLEAIQIVFPKDQLNVRILSQNVKICFYQSGAPAFLFAK